MNILAINTAFNQSYVAVTTNQKTVLNEMDSSLKQSENILGLIDKSLTDAQIGITNLDAIACVIGPGSFTGIRIGASLAKGFCSALPHIKRIAINSLDLLAYSFAKTMPNNDFFVVLNALSGNYFVCKYNSNGTPNGEPYLAFGDELANIIGVVVGLLEENLEICNEFVELNSKDLLDFAVKQNKVQTYNTEFTPLYLRKSQAEAELDKKNGNN